MHALINSCLSQGLGVGRPGNGSEFKYVGPQPAWLNSYIPAGEEGLGVHSPVKGKVVDRPDSPAVRHKVKAAPGRRVDDVCHRAHEMNSQHDRSYTSRGTPTSRLGGEEPTRSYCSIAKSACKVLVRFAVGSLRGMLRSRFGSEVGERPPEIKTFGCGRSGQYDAECLSSRCLRRHSR